MTMVIEGTTYSPLNTPIDGDRDYYDLTGFYQQAAAPSPLEGCGCNSLSGCSCGTPLSGLAEEKSGNPWLPLGIIVGLWGLMTFGGDILNYFDPDGAQR